MVEKEQSRQGIGYEIDTGVTSPPSPPSHHEKWKMARIKMSSAFSFEQSRTVSEKIESYFYPLFHIVSYFYPLFQLF